MRVYNAIINKRELKIEIDERFRIDRDKRLRIREVGTYSWYLIDVDDIDDNEVIHGTRYQ